MSEKTRCRSARFAVRYRSVFFPFDVTELFGLLPSQGFVVAEELLRVPSLRTRARIDGVVARKLDTNLFIDTEKQNLIMAAADLGKCVDELSAIEDSLETEVGFDSRADAWFYEASAEFLITTGRDPLEVLGDRLVQRDVLRDLSTAFGRDLSGFGLRLRLAGAAPNCENWLDLQLEPTILTPHTSYTANLVCRDEDRAKVVGFARDLAKSLDKTISVLEA